MKFTISGLQSAITETPSCVFAGQRAILKRWASLAPNDTHGFRAPYLTPGGDPMADAIQYAGVGIIEPKLSNGSGRTTWQTRFISGRLMILQAKSVDMILI